jgi:hypothetical protein
LPLRRLETLAAPVDGGHFSHAPGARDLAATARLDGQLLSRVETALDDFVTWLDRYGETSHDFQTFYAGRYGRFAKALYYRRKALGTCAVAPMVFSEAFLPSARRLFWIRQRFPIADAHYSMGFARLFQRTGNQRHLDRAIHFLDVLLSTACRGDSGLGWGYPFDWETIDGTLATQTPLITTLPYVYEAFAAVHQIDGQSKWLEVMRSIAEHAYQDYPQLDAGDGAKTSAYTPLQADRGRVVNASAYRAFLLTKAAVDLGQTRFSEAAETNVRFVLKSQNPDGSWYYAVDGRRHFIDHYHTCFVMKALVKVWTLTGDAACQRAVEKGMAYYLGNLFDDQGLPKPFAKPPRLIVYRRELYDYAECVNLALLVGGRFQKFEALVPSVLEDLLTRWRRSDGSFKSRQLLFGWDAVPMHRWAQAQLFNSLSGILLANRGDAGQSA